jgi:hypothetical protein
MNKIKHSKYKNTGLLFNLLVKQLTADILEGRDSACAMIIKKYFHTGSSLSKENKLYQTVVESTNTAVNKANAVVFTVLEISRKLGREKLLKLKYDLIKEIKSNYDLDEFFTIKIPEYKILAATYTLLEAHNTPELVDPEIIISNKTTLLEHMTQATPTNEDSRESLIEEYSKYDDDLRLLAYRILLEKFNTKYKTLLPEQKLVLKEFVTSVSSTKKLKTFINERIKTVRESLETLKGKVSDEILRIKLTELLNHVAEIKTTEKVEDTHLVTLMNYYELIEELKHAE